MLRDRLKRIFHFDPAYFFHGGLRLGIGQVIFIALSFTLSIVLVNAMPKETYGQYKYAFALFTFISLPALSEMMTAVIRSVSRGFDGSVRAGMKLKLRWAFLGTLGGFGLAAYYFMQGNSALAAAIVIGAVCIPFTETLSLYDAYYQGKRQFGRSMRVAVSIQLVYAAVLIGTALMTQALWAIIFAAYAALLAGRGLAARSVLREIPKTSPSDPELMHTGGHLSVIKLSSFVTSSLWSVALFHVLGADQLAIYSVAVAPIEQIRGFLLIGENLILPKASDVSWKLGNAKTFWRKMVPVLVIVLVGIFIYRALAAPFYHIFFPKYSDAIGYSMLYAWSLLFTSVQIVVNTILKARAIMRQLYILNFLETAFSVFLALPMIFFFQINGLLISLIIMKAVLVSVALFFLFIPKKEPHV